MCQPFKFDFWFKNPEMESRSIGGVRFIGVPVEQLEICPGTLRVCCKRHERYKRIVL